MKHETPSTPALILARLKAGDLDRRRDFGLTRRQAALKALDRGLRAARGDIHAALAADLGKSAEEADLVELLPALDEIAHVRRHLAGWMRPVRAWPTLLTAGLSARQLPQPKGTVLIIAPWNYPLLLSVGPLVSAIAAGNAAVLKPSELTPMTSALMARLFPALLPGLVEVVEGGAEVSADLTSLPFDHIFFTGSPAVGARVLAAAAPGLVPVTLELGGKSPVVVGQGADISRAARWVAWGKGTNAGQICVAPDHVLVARGLEKDFTAALKAELVRMYGPRPGAERRMTRVVNARHRARLASLEADARGKGAGIEPLWPDGADDLAMAPRLVTGVSADMEIAREEIFGPLLPVLPFGDPSDAIAVINAGPKPLTLYVFGNRALVDKVAAETQSGSLGVNLTLLTFAHPNLPVGGIGQSGMGAGHGRTGFATFSHMKPVLTNRFSPLPLAFPPQGRLIRRAIAWLVGGRGRG